MVVHNCKIPERPSEIGFRVKNLYLFHIAHTNEDTANDWLSD